MSSTTYTTNLRLAIDENLTRAAKANLQKIDALGATWRLNSSGDLEIISVADIYLSANSGAGDFLVRGDVLPYTDATFDLGSALAQWRHLFMSGDATIGGDLTLVGTATLGSLVVSGTISAPSLTLSGNLSVGGDITVGGTVDGRDIAADGTSLDDHIAASANIHGIGVGSDVVGTIATQTLTNKSLDAAFNTIINLDDSSISAAAAIARSKLAPGNAGYVVVNNGSGILSDEQYLSKARGGAGADVSSVTFPSSGTIVTEGAAQTLTNKSMDAGSNTFTNIPYSSLVLTTSIMNSDVNGGAAIAGTKISPNFGSQNVLTSGNFELVDSVSGFKISLVVPTPLSSSLSLTLPCVSGTPGQLLTTNGPAGVLSWTSVTTTDYMVVGHVDIGNALDVRTQVDTATLGDIAASTTGGLEIKSGVIVNDDINASAAIAHSKMAALTASRALVSDASGFATASAATAAEVGYLSGVTSALQSQLNGKQATITGAATTVVSLDLTASRVVVSDTSGKIAASSVATSRLDEIAGASPAFATSVTTPKVQAASTAGLVLANNSGTTCLTLGAGGGAACNATFTDGVNITGVLDQAGAAALEIGKNNATSITLGKVGVTTTIAGDLTVAGTTVSFTSLGSITKAGAGALTLSAAGTSVITIPTATDTMALLGTTQTFTGNKAFSGTLEVPATVSYTSNGSIVKSGNHALTLTTTNTTNATFPTGTVTVAALQTAQTFTAAQTFSAGVTISAGQLLRVNRNTSADSIVASFGSNGTDAFDSYVTVDSGSANGAESLIFFRHGDVSKGSIGTTATTGNLNITSVGNDVVIAPASGVAATFTSTAITLTKATTFSGGFATQTISGAVTWSGVIQFNGNTSFGRAFTGTLGGSNGVEIASTAGKITVVRSGGAAFAVDRLTSAGSIVDVYYASTQVGGIAVDTGKMVLFGGTSSANNNIELTSTAATISVPLTQKVAAATDLTIWSATDTSPVAGLKLQRGATGAGDAYTDFRIYNDVSLKIDIETSGTTINGLTMSNDGVVTVGPDNSSVSHIIRGSSLRLQNTTETADTSKLVLIRAHNSGTGVFTSANQSAVLQLQNSNNTAGNYSSVVGVNSAGQVGPLLSFVNVDHTTPKMAWSVTTRNASSFNQAIYAAETGAVTLGPASVTQTHVINGHSVTLPRVTTTQRDAVTAAAGMLIYNTTTSKVQVYTTSWIDLH